MLKTDREQLQYVENQVTSSLLAEAQSMKELEARNIAQLHLLVYHLTSTFTHYPEISKIPSANVLKVLLTIVARSPVINRPHADGSVLSGFARTGESDDDVASYTRLRDSAYQLLNSFIGALEIRHSQEEYVQLLSLFSEFVVEPKLFSVIPSQTKPKPRSKNSTKDKSKPAKPESPEPSEVSDSDGVSKLEASPAQEEDPIRQNAFLETLLSESRPPSRRERTPPVATRDEDTLFNDKLITTKLRPTAHSSYCMWDLIRWAFYCANYSGSSGSTIHRSIYESHRDFVSLAFRFVNVDFVRFLNQSSHGSIRYIFGVSAGDRHALLQEFGSTLVSKLVAQTAGSKSSWFDRIMEHTFSGLDGYVSTRPPACFATEASLTLDVRSPSRSEPSSSCNIDSMELRFDIIYTSYLFSLFRSTNCFVDSLQSDERYNELDDVDDPTSSVNFVRQLTERILEIDTEYFEQFYLEGLSRVGHQDDSTYLVQMLIQTAGTVLFELTDDIEVYAASESILRLIAQKQYEKLVQTTVSFLTEFVELVPHDNATSFRKLNFMVYWYLQLAQIYGQSANEKVGPTALWAIEKALVRGPGQLHWQLTKM